MNEYKPQELDKKWQQLWQEKELYKAEDFSDKDKRYVLIEFPYPSGDGLHVGHCLSYIAQDVVARYYRLQNYNVLYPIGWDAFGLPAENYAIKHKIHPREAVAKNVANFKRQIMSLGISFDWSREINTTDPKYYKWTQWIFLQLFKAGLAEKKEVPINWCPSCKIGLAFEEVIDGKCERCGSEVEQRTIAQWILKITKYADRLIDDLDTVDYLPHIKQQQINWIGRSEGLEIDFVVGNEEWVMSDEERKNGRTEEHLRVFTTRPDTIFGATFLVIAPDHPLVHSMESQTTNLAEVKNYVEQAAKLSDREKQEKKDKTGVQLKGLAAVHPITHSSLPIFIADYVMMSYATGSIMAVPAHDERDWEFAKLAYGKWQMAEGENDLIKPVICPKISNVVMIHGCPGSEEKVDPESRTFDKHWQPWLKQQLENMSVKVEAPIMPDPVRPIYSEWKKVMDEINIDENTILVGHSCGTSFLTRWLGDTGKKVKKLIMVAPWKIPSGDFKVIKDEFYSYTLNPSLNTNIEEIIMFTADDEEPEGKESLKIYQKVLKGRVISLSGHGHYTAGDMGKVELPELLSEIIGSEVYTGDGYMINSGKYNGLFSQEGWQKIADDLEQQGIAQRKINYKLHDWIFSRQHYWGEPIPIIICDQCGFVPLEAKDLPLELPDVDYYEPTDTGESPLAKITDWVNVKCPKCGGAAKRETDTMPNWAGSSWYYLRYCDPHNDKELAAKHKLEYWLPVDLYNGGMEHTTLHLLYSRFWHKFLYDQKIVPTAEPYARRIAHGMILGPDGQKMSKSRGNVITPDEIVTKYGADSLRLYEMFMGEYQDTKNWSTASLQGVYRFLTKVWNFFQTVKIGDYDNPHLKVTLHQSIKKITEDFERRSFNTTVSQLMILFNEMSAHDEVGQQTLEIFVILMSPLAPHTAEELWQKLGHDQSVHQSSWPKYDKQLLETQEIIMAVQINGKVRAQVAIGPDETEDQIKQKVLALRPVQKYLAGQQPKKFIYIKGKIISIVV